MRIRIRIRIPNIELNNQFLVNYPTTLNTLQGTTGHKSKRKERSRDKKTPRYRYLIHQEKTTLRSVSLSSLAYLIVQVGAEDDGLRYLVEQESSWQE